jgi:hypothetical protein
VFTTHNTSIVRGYCYCPICSESYWFGETISRIVLEILLGFKFSKTKCIEGLEDPITGHNLEIDGFNLKNKIGFEYQGSQHYQFSSKFHKTKQDFKQLQNHDKIKKEFFLNKGWVLLEIKQFENIEIEKVITSIKENLQVNAPYLVYKKCDNEKIIEAIKVTLFGKKSSKSFNELLSNFDYLNKGMDFLNKHGAKLLSGSFKSKESKIVIETKQGLIWRTTVESLLRSIECNAINIVNKYNLKEAKLQEILKQANKYTDLTTFKKKHHKLSEWVRRNHYTNELRAVFGLEPAKEKGIRQYTDEYLINEAKKFKTRGQMYHEGRNAYELILLRKLQPLAFAHMVTPSRKKKK